MGTKDFPPGMIGIVHRTITMAAGWGCLIQLERPELTGITTMTGSAISEQRNNIVKMFMDRPEYKWLLWIDDDQTYPPDALLRLLAHDKPIVSAIISQRNHPFMPQFFFDSGDPEHPLRRAARAECVGNDPIQIGATGCGFTLIQRKVFEDMEFPWYASRWDGVGEDIFFCLKAAKLGHSVWCDKSLKIGHLTVVNVLIGEDGEPQFTQDRWLPRKVVTK